MKERIKLKDLKASVNTIISIPYCDLYYLLDLEPTPRYMKGVYGWNCDVYIYGDVAICTGYRCPKGIRPKASLVEEYNEWAKAVRLDASVDYDSAKVRIHNAVADFIGEVIGM